MRLAQTMLEWLSYDLLSLCSSHRDSGASRNFVEHELRPGVEKKVSRAACLTMPGSWPSFVGSCALPFFFSRSITPCLQAIMTRTTSCMCYVCMYVGPAPCLEVVQPEQAERQDMPLTGEKSGIRKRPRRLGVCIRLSLISLMPTAACEKCQCRTHDVKLLV